MPSYIYVIDDRKLVPAGYESRPLSHEQAVDELRGNPLVEWLMEDLEGDTYAQLRLLMMKSQTGMGYGSEEFLEHTRVTDPQRLQVDGPHTYLLLRADRNPELFTPGS